MVRNTSGFTGSSMLKPGGKARLAAAWLVMGILTLPARADYIPFDFEADGGNSGRTVANFLLLPVGAQQLAIGPVPSMVAWDATDIAAATGNTAFFRQYQFAVTHLEWLMGLRKEYAAGCIPLLDVGTLGFYSQVFTLGRFDNARDIDENPVTKSKSVEINVGASFARELIPDLLGVGATASYIESRLAGDDARAFNAGVDGTYKPMKKLAGRAYIRNLGSPIVYNETLEALPLQMGGAVEFSPWVADDTLLRKSFSMSTALGVQKSADLPVQVGIGLEVSPFKQLAFRAGYEYSYGHDWGLAGLSFGAGLAIKGYAADVGFKHQSPEFGWVWAATAKFATEEVRQKSAEEHYKIAEKHFKKERYRLCIQSATHALKLNPDMWQAHELITRSIAAMRRREGSEMLLVYTGNLKGQFAPLTLGEATMGGLARQATVIKALRAKYPVCIAVDAGNFVQAHSHELKAEFAATYFNALEYDLAGMGPGEIDYGLKRYLKGNRGLNPPALLTNVSRTAGAGTTDMRIHSAGKYSFAVFTIVGPAMVTDARARAQLTNAIPFVRKELQSERVKKCNLRILVLHTPWEVAKAYARQIPGIDIIVMGSLAHKFDVPMKIKETVCLSAGEYGKYVGALTLRFNKRGELLSYNNRLVPLIEEVAPDPEIDKATRSIIAKIDRAQQGLADLDLSQVPPHGVFAFLSDRRGAPDIYLKVPMQRAEFPLTATGTRCAAPRISYASDRIVYLEENDSTGATELKVMELTGAKKQTLPMPGEVREAVLSSDGNWAFAAVQSQDGVDIFRIKSTGGEALPVVTWPGSDERQIAFSPDGHHMAFASDRDGKWQVYLTDTSGSKPVRLTDPNAHHVKPRFSYDGALLAYLSDRHSFGGKKDIWVHTVATGEEARVSAGTPVNEFSWLYDNKTLVFSSGLDTLRLGRTGLDNAEHAVLIASDSVKAYNETTPRMVRFKGATRIVYVREYPDGEKRIFWCSPDGSDDRSVVHSKKRDWLE
ncbi:MAG: PorV/PorQ family protein [Chitinivibrionales bacterium]|nr:PorV/PorQ family protein [Chitinivibrionales bacterium]MBD3395242.1 PorV/PorQ family protein [Chitinivibrionales bacterium]